MKFSEEIKHIMKKLCAKACYLKIKTQGTGLDLTRKT